MADRREFLQYAMVSAVPLATGVSLEAAASARLSATPARPCAVTHGIVDARHAESLDFGASLAGHGVRVHVLPDGDATDLWQQTLSSAWREGPVPVAGLTRAPTLFILEQLAYSHGLRVVYLAEHVVGASAPAVHHVLRASGTGLVAQDLARLDARWPRHVAGIVAQFSPAGARAGRPGPTASGLLPALPADAQLLTSWIIAPA